VPWQTYSARKQALLEFVGSISPSPDISAFDVPAPVVSAVRQTVSNLLGTLPPQFFRVTISTRGDNLAQLMFSVLMTGYMFGGAWTRMQLTQSMAPPADARVGSAVLGSIDDFGTCLESAEYLGSESNSSQMAAGAQKLRVQGEVLRWHHEDGVQQVDALDYIEQLEAEVVGLRKLVEKAQRSAQRAMPAGRMNSLGNELLDYLRGLSSEQVSEFTDCASPDVLNAMNELVGRMIGGDEGEGEWAGGRSDCTAPELAQMLYWLMAVGHRLRALEVRLSLHAALEAGPLGRDPGIDGADGSAGPAADWVPRLPPGR